MLEAIVNGEEHEVPSRTVELAFELAKELDEGVIDQEVVDDFLDNCEEPYAIVGILASIINQEPRYFAKNVIVYADEDNFAILKVEDEDHYEQ